MNALTSAWVDDPPVPTPLPMPDDIADRLRARGGYGTGLWREAAVAGVAELLYDWRTHRPGPEFDRAEVDCALLPLMESVVREELSGVTENWTSVLLGRLSDLKAGVLGLPVVGLEPGRSQVEGLDAQVMSKCTLGWARLAAEYEKVSDLPNAVACGACALYVELSHPCLRDPCRTVDALVRRRELALGAAGCCRLSMPRQAALRRRLRNFIYPS
jgi:hypothetical protein